MFGWRTWTYCLGALAGAAMSVAWLCYWQPVSLGLSKQEERIGVAACIGAIAGLVPGWILSTLVRGRRRGAERSLLLSRLRALSTHQPTSRAGWNVFLLLWIAAAAVGVWWFIVREPDEHTRLRGHSKIVQSLEFSANGRRLLSASEDETWRVWDVASGKELWQFKHEPFAEYRTPRAPAAALSPDGKQVFYTDLRAYGTDLAYLVRDLDSGKDARRLPRPAATPVALAWTSAGPRALLKAGGNNPKTTLWDAGGGAALLELADAYRAGFVGAGRFVISRHLTGDHDVRLWDATTGAAIQSWKWRPEFLSVSGDGRRILGGGGWAKEFRAYDVPSGKELRRFDWPPEEETRVALTANGRQAWTIAKFGILTLQLWSLDDGRQISRHRKELFSKLTAVACSPDGHWAACGDEHGQVFVWRPVDAEPKAPAK